MNNFYFKDSPQYYTLAEALKLASYETIALAALAVIDSNEATPDNVKGAIRAMAFKMATLNGGHAEAGTILHHIQTTTWAFIGLPVDGIPALDNAQREAIVNVIMGVSKQIILAEGVRLYDLANTNTALVEG